MQCSRMAGTLSVINTSSPRHANDRSAGDGSGRLSTSVAFLAPKRVLPPTSLDADAVSFQTPLGDNFFELPPVANTCDSPLVALLSDSIEM
jgi:hypothetical protein